MQFFQTLNLFTYLESGGLVSILISKLNILFTGFTLIRSGL